MDAIQRLRRGVDTAAPTVASVAEPVEGAAAAAASGTSSTNLATDTMDTMPSTIDNVKDALIKQLHKLPCEYPNLYLGPHVGVGRG